MQSLRFPKVRGTFCLLCGGGTSTNTSHRANTVRVKIMFASVVARLLPSALPPAPSTSPPVSRLYVRGEPHDMASAQCLIYARARVQDLQKVVPTPLITEAPLSAPHLRWRLAQQCAQRRLPRACVRR